MQTTGIAHQLTALQDRNLKPMASSSNGGAAGSDSASIGANDFLTLLVTEMKNQDPTANTDPNEYINQLVQVNSLEQLISINQTLQTDSAPTTSPDVSSQHRALQSSHPPGSAPLPLDAHLGDTQHRTIQRVPGNLSIPQRNDAAVRVAHSMTSH